MDNNDPEIKRAYRLISKHCKSQAPTDRQIKDLNIEANDYRIIDDGAEVVHVFDFDYSPTYKHFGELVNLFPQLAVSFAATDWAAQRGEVIVAELVDPGIDGDLWDVIRSDAWTILDVIRMSEENGEDYYFEEYLTLINDHLQDRYLYVEEGSLYVALHAMESVQDSYGSYLLKLCTQTAGV